MPITTSFAFKVTIYCDTLEEAQKVLTERLEPDEDYGFQYLVDYDPTQHRATERTNRLRNAIESDTWAADPRLPR